MSNDPVVIVTGASRGLGAAVAQWLGSIGAKVGLVARSEQGLASVAESVRRLGGEALPIPGDVSRWEVCSSAVEKVVEKFGKLDALINNAGILEPMSTVDKADVAEWRHNIAVNVFGPFQMSKAALAALRNTGGRIVNISSGAANSVLEAASAYCAAKAALNHFTRILAAEENYLIVVAVRPGVVDTKMQEMLREKGPHSMPEHQAAFFQNLKREEKLEPPHIPARAIAWLSLHANKEMNGQFLDYDDSRIVQPAVEKFGRRLPE